MLDREQLKKLCKKFEDAHHWINGKEVKSNLDSLLAEIKKEKK